MKIEVLSIDCDDFTEIDRAEPTPKQLADVAEFMRKYYYETLSEVLSDACDNAGVPRL